METLMDRREFFSSAGLGLGSVAMTQMMLRDASAGLASSVGMHHAARAKRVIYLFQSGAPSQIDLWDPKPTLNERARHRVT